MTTNPFATEPEIWTTALGEKKKFSEIDHQHLSNILWFQEVFNNATRYNNDAFYLLNIELYKRFEGNRLQWKPLPIPHEIKWLRDLGKISSDGDIIHGGHVIGSITHIENWKEH